MSLARSSSLCSEPEIPVSVFRAFADRVRQESGIVLGPEKTSLVQARLHRVALDRGYASLPAYLDHVARRPTRSELREAVECLTTNHTYFWREADHFEQFRREVLPPMRQVLSKPGPTRIWCAASSTGQEPWTLAGLVQEVAPCTFARRSICATDLSSEVIETARAGTYRASDVQRLPLEHRGRWFRQRGGQYVVAPALQDEVTYRVLNLMDATYPWRGTLHAVFCRNVLIYFDAPTRLAVIERMRATLRPGGWLFLSQTEALPREAGGWERVGAGVSRRVG